MNYLMKYLKIKLLIISLFSYFIGRAELALPEPQNPARLVNNFSKEFPDFLSSSEIAALEAKLVEFDDASSNQICVVIVDDFDGTDAGDYANQLFNKWGIGNAKTKNGVLLLIKPTKKNALYIEVGYGLEGAIPDISAKHVIEDIIAPRFKQGAFYQGVDEGTDVLMKMAVGEYKTPRKKKGPGGGSRLVLIILFIILLLIFSRGRGGGLGGFLLGNAMGSMLGSSGRSSWGGGGGFGGFGGGSSGGGGAGGSW